MNKSKDKGVLEYLSLILVISYLIFHNIFLVIIGISFSIFSMNIEFRNRLHAMLNNKEEQESIRKDNPKQFESISINSNNEISRLTLVEKVKNLELFHH